MNTIFEQLWNGTIKPHQECGRGDQEIEHLADLIKRNQSSLTAELGENQRELLDRYIKSRDEYDYLTQVYAFEQGFSLASRLLSEALQHTPAL